MNRTTEEEFVHQGFKFRFNATEKAHKNIALRPFWEIDKQLWHDGGMLLRAQLSSQIMGQLKEQFDE